MVPFVKNDASMIKRKLRTVVVDDSLVCRKAAVSYLSKIFQGPALMMTPTFEECGDGDEAVQLIQSTMQTNMDALPDVIFMDSHMIKMDGVKATEKLRSIGYKGIIAALTGNVFQDDIDAFTRAGANVVLPKPLCESDMRSLLTMLREAVRERLLGR